MAQPHVADPSTRCWLVVVNGPPASGKTTLAKTLAEKLALPLIAKDDLKVILYDTLGWGGRERDRKVSDAAYELMYHLAATELRAGRSVMLESNFRPEAGARLAELLRRYRAAAIQIRCSAPREVLIRRLEERVRSGARHPGHADEETLSGELEGLLASGSALELGGQVIEVDTVDPQLPEETIAKALQKEMGL